MKKHGLTNEPIGIHHLLTKDEQIKLLALCIDYNVPIFRKTYNLKSDNEFKYYYWDGQEFQRRIDCEGIKSVGLNEFRNIITGGIEVEEPKVNILTLSEPIGDYVIFNSKKYVPEQEEPKEESFVITATQLKQLHVQGTDYTRFDLEYLFPTVFEPEKKELVVDFTGWCKAQGYGNEKWIGYFENGFFKYGFGADGKWFSSDGTIHKFKITPSYYPAEQQEVEEALKAEAVRRYKVGDIVLINDNKHKLSGLDTFGGFCHFYDNIIWMNEHESSNVRVFDNGKWATIIHPKKMTQAEIEKELGYNIEIV